jgi:enoyl-CoA hydratase/carnithine racemase
VLVVTGSGNTFSSGANLSTTRAIADPDERERRFAAIARSRIRLLGRVVDALVHLEQVTIAAINGYAVGAGWDLALACDLRIAVEEAEFWFPEVDLGVPLSPEATALLLEHVPPAVAKEMILGCARYRAEELLRFGLVNRVVPKSGFAAAVRELAEALSRKNPAAVTGTKATVNALAHRRGLLRLDLLRTRE